MPFVEYDEVEAICSDCGRLFRSEEALAAHREESHSGREEPPARREEPAVCPTCHRTLSSASALRAHLDRSHSKA
jgi:C2H2-type zinc finger/Zinc finger, C2H2 type